MSDDLPIDGSPPSLPTARTQSSRGDYPGLSRGIDWLADAAVEAARSYLYPPRAREGQLDTEHGVPPLPPVVTELARAIRSALRPRTGLQIGDVDFGAGEWIPDFDDELEDSVGGQGPDSGGHPQFGGRRQRDPIGFSDVLDATRPSVELRVVFGGRNYDRGTTLTFDAGVNTPVGGTTFEVFEVEVGRPDSTESSESTDHGESADHERLTGEDESSTPALTDPAWGAPIGVPAGQGSSEQRHGDGGRNGQANESSGSSPGERDTRSGGASSENRHLSWALWSAGAAVRFGVARGDLLTEGWYRDSIGLDEVSDSDDDVDSDAEESSSGSEVDDSSAGETPGSSDSGSTADGESSGDESDDESESDGSGGKKGKGRKSRGSIPKPFGADESSGSEGGRSVFEGVVGGFGPWVNPGRQSRGRSTGGGRVLETRGDLAPWVYGDPRGGGQSGGRGALRDVGFDPWTNPKRDDDYGDGARGAFPVDPGTDPVAGFRNVARASRSSQSSLALAMGINPAALEEFE